MTVDVPGCMISSLPHVMKHSRCGNSVNKPNALMCSCPIAQQTRPGGAPTDMYRKTRDRPKPPGLLPTISEHVDAVAQVVTTSQIRDDSLYRDLHQAKLKRERIADFLSTRPTLEHRGQSSSQPQPEWGSWHWHPDLPGLHCLMWDGPVSREEAALRGHFPPESVVVAFNQRLLQNNLRVSVSHRDASSSHQVKP